MHAICFSIIIALLHYNSYNRQSNRNRITGVSCLAIRSDTPAYYEIILINYLSDNKTRKGLNSLFDEIKDKRIGEITPKELSKIAQENEEPLDEKDFEFILKTIAGNSNSININQDEFYYIMTKSPEEALKITLATKTSKIK